MKLSEIIQEAMHCCIDDTFVEFMAIRDDVVYTAIVLLTNDIQNAVIESWGAIENAEYYFPDNKAIRNHFGWLPDIANLTYDVEIG